MPPVNPRKGWSPKTAVLRVCPQAYATTDRIPAEGSTYAFKQRSVYERKGGRLLGRDAVGVKAWEAALATLAAEGKTKPHIPITAEVSTLLTVRGHLTFIGDHHAGT